MQGEVRTRGDYEWGSWGKWVGGAFKGSINIWKFKNTHVNVNLLPAIGKAIFNSLVQEVLICGHLCCCQDERWVCCSILRLVLFDRCRGQKKCNDIPHLYSALQKRLLWIKMYMSEQYASLITLTFSSQTWENNQLYAEHSHISSESQTTSIFILITSQAPASAEIAQESHQYLIHEHARLHVQWFTTWLTQTLLCTSFHTTVHTEKHLKRSVLPFLRHVTPLTSC